MTRRRRRRTYIFFTTSWRSLVGAAVFAASAVLVGVFVLGHAWRYELAGATTVFLAYLFGYSARVTEAEWPR